MKEHTDKLDKAIQEKMHAHEVPVPSHLWDSIEARLPSQKNNSPFSFLKNPFVLSVLLIVALTGLYTYHLKHQRVQVHMDSIKVTDPDRSKNTSGNLTTYALDTKAPKEIRPAAFFYKTAANAEAAERTGTNRSIIAPALVPAHLVYTLKSPASVPAYISPVNKYKQAFSKHLRNSKIILHAADISAAILATNETSSSSLFNPITGQQALQAKSTKQKELNPVTDMPSSAAHRQSKQTEHPIHSDSIGFMQYNNHTGLKDGKSSMHKSTDTMEYPVHAYADQHANQTGDTIQHIHLRLSNTHANPADLQAGDMVYADTSILTRYDVTETVSHKEQQLQYPFFNSAYTSADVHKKAAANDTDLNTTLNIRTWQDYLNQEQITGSRNIDSTPVTESADTSFLLKTTEQTAALIEENTKHTSDFLSRCSFDGYVTPAAGYLFTAGNTNSEAVHGFAKDRNKNTDAGKSITVGIRINYALTRKLEIGIGLQYSGLQQSSSLSVANPDSTFTYQGYTVYDSIYDSTSQSYIFNNHFIPTDSTVMYFQSVEVTRYVDKFRNFSIPIHMAYGYSVTDRFSLITRTSFLINYQTYSMTYMNETDHTILGYQSHKRISVGGSFSIGAYYVFSKKCSVFAEPILMYYFSNLFEKQAPFKQTQLMLGIQTGLRLNF